MIVNKKHLKKGECTLVEENLGVDIGGVIIDRINDGTDTSFFSENFLQTTAVEGSFEALARLRQERFGERIALISNCGVRIERKTHAWLALKRFFEETGINPKRLYFCRARRDKAPICKRLGITHYIDDRLEIHGYLDSVAHKFLFRPRPGEVEKFSQHLDSVRVVHHWSDIVEDLLV